MDAFRADDFDEDFSREIVKDDGSAARAILASGKPIHVSRDDTPDGHVVRIHPDGREELVPIDRDALIRTLGR